MSTISPVQTTPPTVNRLRAVTAAGLIVSCSGILVQRLSGVEMPAVPPGAVIMLLPALLITVFRWRWLPILGVLAAGSELAGLTAVGAVSALGGASAPGIVVGAWLRLAGAVAAVLAGVLGTALSYRLPTPR